MSKFISLGSIALISSMTILGFSNPVKADDVACVTDGTTAVCADSQGNAAVSTVEADGTQTTVGVGADGSTSVQVDTPAQ
jgi:hypothetical protein